MDVTGGGLSWTFELDYSQIGSARSALVKYFNDIGLNAEEAGKRADEAMNNLQSIIAEATKEVGSQAEAIEMLNAAYEEMQEQIASMDDGPEKEVFQGITEGLRSVVEEFGHLNENVPSARQQLREMTEELVAMKLRGEENTEAYQQLLEKVGTLKDAMADTQQAVKGMASDTATLDSVLGAAQLTAGGFSAIIGAMNLVGAGEDTKELAEAQKKLQAAIAVTTGLQSVQNALQKQSALMLGIQKLQTLAAAKAEDIKTAATGRGVIATKAATVAQKAFNAVAKANPYVLLAMAILTVVGALAAFTSGTKENERQQKSLNDELERQLDILNKLNGVYNTQQSNEINKLQNILDLLKARGESIEVIRDAEDQLDKAEKARIDREKEEYKDLLDNAQMYEDKLEELRQKVKEKNDEGNEAKARMTRPGDPFSADYSTWEVPQNHPNYIADQTDAMVDATLEELESVQKVVDKIHQIQQDEENYQTKKQIREAERAAEDKKRMKEASERRQKNLGEEKKYQEELRQARERAEDLELDGGSDNINTRVAKLELDYDRQIAEAQQKAEEARKNKKVELAEQYERQVSALMKKRDAEINKLYANEEEAQAQAVAETLDNYKGYDARRREIEKRYADDIKKLAEKREEFEEGSDEWLTYNQAIAEAVRQQQDELDDLEVEYGTLNQLTAKRESLERQILIVANKIKNAKTDEEKNALVNEMARLKSEFATVNAEINEMNGQLAVTEESLEEISATDIISIARDLTDAFTVMSGASKETADNVGIIADGISSVVSGYAQGGVVGAIIGAIGWAVDGMMELAEQTAKENEELDEFKAQLDKIHQSFHLNEGSFDSIFGDDAIGKMQATADIIDGYTKQVRLLLQYYTSGAVSNMFDFSTYRIAGLNNQNLEEIAQEWGLNLFDSSGNGYNTDFIQKVLDQYGDKLSADEKRLLQSMLNYSEAFQDAMTEVASYLTSLFGNVADTIADQFLDTFLESGQAAMDFGAVVSDVAKNMAKDFIKNLLIERVFKDMQDSFESIMADDSLTPEQKQAQLIGWLAAAQADVEALQPEIQAYLEAMSQFFGAGDEIADAAMSGNLLQSASQDSVSLLNGQLNAIRTNQALVTGRMDSILLQLAGIHDEVRDFHGDSNTKLNQLIENTSERGSILRQLGIWIG